MGLFKNLLESVAGIDLNKVKEAISNLAEQAANQTAAPARETPAYVPSEEAEAPDWTPAEWRDYFRGILQSAARARARYVFLGSMLDPRETIALRRGR